MMFKRQIKTFRKFLHLEHLKIQLFNTTLALIRKWIFNLEMYIYIRFYKDCSGIWYLLRIYIKTKT